MSSGNRKVHRLSRRGNRRLNRAIHMAAVTQIRDRHSEGRACYDKKIAEGKTPKEALRALKRQVSDALCNHLKADAARAAAAAEARDPGGHAANDSGASAAGSHPRRRLFGQATPGPVPTLRPEPGPAKTMPAPRGAPRTARRSGAVLAGDGADDRGGEPIAQPALGMGVLTGPPLVDGEAVKGPGRGRSGPRRAASYPARRLAAAR